MILFEHPFPYLLTFSRGLWTRPDQVAKLIVLAMNEVNDDVYVEPVVVGSFLLRALPSTPATRPHALIHKLHCVMVPHTGE